MNDTATALVTGYRALADFIEAHADEFRWPMTAAALVLYGEEETADNVKRLARLLVPVTKEFEGEFFVLTRHFSNAVSLRVVFSRHTVCTKRVLGTKRVQAQFFPARDEEIVEWDCGPLLGEVKPEPAEKGTP